MLQEAGRPRADVTAVVGGLGPGPFTGLRVGLVTARTFAFALGIPVLGVCSLDALAHQAWREGAVTGGFARRRRTPGARRSTGRATTSPPTAPSGSRSRGVDPGRRGRGARRRAGRRARVALLYPELLPGRVGPLDVSAGHLADLAVRRLAAGADLSDVEPLYLRRPDAVPTAERAAARCQ